MAVRNLPLPFAYLQEHRHEVVLSSGWMLPDREGIDSFKVTVANSIERIPASPTTSEKSDKGSEKTS